MLVRELCNRNTVTIAETASVAEAAQLMKQKRVGCIVVLEGESAKSGLIGVLSDRDIVVECVAAGLDPDKTLVRSLIKRDVVAINHAENLQHAVKLMNEHAIRCLPVLTDGGDLLGLVSADDLLREMSKEISDLAHIVDAKLLKADFSGTAARRQLLSR